MEIRVKFTVNVMAFGLYGYESRLLKHSKNALSLSCPREMESDVMYSFADLLTQRYRLKTNLCNTKGAHPEVKRMDLNQEGMSSRHFKEN